MFLALNLVLTKKQRFGKHSNTTILMPVCQKLTKKDYKDIDIYYIGYVTVKKIANCNNINSGSPLHLMINEMIGHFEGKNKNKYLVLEYVDENKEVSKKYEEVW